MAQIEILDPVAEGASVQTKLSPRPRELGGKVVGMRICWDSFDVFCGKLEELLRAEHGIGDVVRLKFDLLRGKGLRAGQADSVAEAVDDFAKRIDVAVVGLGA
ncbi:MAG: hypothetical protein HYX92_20850 [Chloroflexi bacterium]|nr:hypothetical protein [Chloroflexota bacterium]